MTILFYQSWFKLPTLVGERRTRDYEEAFCGIHSDSARLEEQRNIKA